jgi:two-component system, LuxR family, sensor kinase FixL
VKSNFYTRLLPGSRRAALSIAIALITAIAIADRLIVRDVSLGILYLFPIVLAAGPLSTVDILLLSAMCAVMRQALGPLGWGPDALSNIAVAAVAYGGTGLLAREMEHLQKAALHHSQVLADEVRRREEAESKLRALVEATPAAMLTLDAAGRVIMGNEAAHVLLYCEPKSLPGQPIDFYLPELVRLRNAHGVRRLLRTTIEGTGYRKGGEAFLANIWVSSLGPPAALELVVVVFDASEQLRQHEEVGLYSLTNSARVIMGTLWHETRNLCSAIRVLVGNLAHRPEVGATEEIEGLSSLVKGLEKVAYCEMQPLSSSFEETASVRIALDHLRIVVEPSFREQGIALHWVLNTDMPLVTADSHGLLQVFLNLTRNASAAMEGSRRKQVEIAVAANDSFVEVRFRNSGPLVQNPERLFKAFPEDGVASGLGLYISRAIMQSFGGDLTYEPDDRGCCFVVKLAISPVLYEFSRHDRQEDSHSAG